MRCVDEGKRRLSMPLTFCAHPVLIQRAYHKSRDFTVAISHNRQIGEPCRDFRALSRAGPTVEGTSKWLR